MELFSRRAALALALIWAAAPALAAGAPAPSGMSLGNPKARVRLDEYASLTCPHCARFNADVFPAFKAKYIDTGKVRFTLHEFITPPAEVAVAGWLIARCSGPTRYFAVVDGIFASQGRWAPGAIKPVLIEVAAKQGGLSEAQVNACITDQKAINALYARMETAMKVSKIEATPTFLVNGKLAHEGEMTLEELDAAIAAAGK